MGILYKKTNESKNSHLFLDLKLIKYIELCQKVDNIIKLIIDSLEDKLSDF